MSLRNNRVARAAARRLPGFSEYETRIAQLTARVAELEAQAHERARQGLWVPPGHFYSPFPDRDEVRRREAEIYGAHPSDVPAVNLGEPAQWALLDEIDDLVNNAELAITPAEARAAGRRYWSDNPAYADGDGMFLSAMLRHFRPKRLIELGCGYSSACTLDTRDQFLPDLDITFVDPYTELLDSLLLPGDRERVRILPIGTQQVTAELVGELQAGDVLFVDSTHVARTGSDVNHIFFRLLPALNPGVIIHIHDVFPRFEYPQPWVYEGRGWTELYVLRAFLQYNASFEVLLWPGHLLSLAPEGMLERFPRMARSWGGAFWMRKVA